jgi:4-carboxymuconolactone decarboxylase
MSEDLFAAVMRMRREVAGDDYVGRALNNVDDFNQDLQKVLTENCWDATQGRVGFSRQQRSPNNLCLLAVPNHRQGFKLHFRGAVRNDCSRDELRETLIQNAVYAEVPAGAEALRIVRKVRAEDGADT